jgi:hypothetical protein
MSNTTTTIDKDAVRTAYEDVRNDGSPTKWALFSYDDQRIVLQSTGSDYDEFKSSFTDDERLYGFIRLDTGDEMSKRAKFVLITWVGANVGALKRAKMSIDKAVVKSVITNFAIEVLATEHEQLEQSSLEEALKKAGGANYGTGVRD